VPNTPTELYSYADAGALDGTENIPVKSGGVNKTSTVAKVVTLATTPVIQSVTSAATVTPTFANDQVNITAQAAGLTLANPTGTAIAAHRIAIRIKDNATPQTIAYGTQYRIIGTTLPTITVASKTLYLFMVFNSTDTKWDVCLTAQEA
jgi:Na+/phosphate symporter